MLKNLYVLAALPINKTESTSQKNDKLNKQFEHYHCKPSDLPLYTPLHERNTLRKVTHLQKSSIISQNIQSGVCIIRSEIQAGLSILGKQKDNINEYLTTAKIHTQSTIDYLNEPQNVISRVSAIAMGGLAGFLFGVRGGIIKKFFYTGIGAGVVASVSYPHQAEQFAQDALYNIRKGFAITYNFIKGTKPGDPITNEPINKFPKSLEDIKFLAYNLYDEAKEALFSKKG